jgi:hypothetical protein
MSWPRVNHPKPQSSNASHSYPRRLLHAFRRFPGAEFSINALHLEKRRVNIGAHFPSADQFQDGLPSWHGGCGRHTGVGGIKTGRTRAAKKENGPAQIRTATFKNIL